MHRWDAERHKTSPSDAQKWGSKLVSKLNLEGGERVPNIGCGSAIQTRPLAQTLNRGLLHRKSESRA